MAAPLCSKQTTNLPIKKKGKMRVGLKKKLKFLTIGHGL
jgi:hypothetical protein